MNGRILALIVCAMGLLGTVARDARAELAQTGFTGGSQPFMIEQPSLGLNYIIRIQGTTNEIGEVKTFAGDFAPRGYAMAHGQVLPIANNTALYSALGTTYGGNGQTTFALPDLRGRTPVHIGQAPGLSNWTQGQQRGELSRTLIEAALPTHAHSLTGHPEPNTATVGNGTPFAIWQPSFGLNHAIATQGIVPTPTGPVSNSPLIGRIKMFAGSSVPFGYLPTNGQILATTLQQDLNTVIGYTYGGDGQNTFALPDLRGRGAMGAGNGAGLTPRLLGETVGGEFSALTIAQMPSHTHALLPPPAPPAPPLTTGATGGSGNPVDIVQPSLPLRYIIATQGAYPIEADTDIGTDQPMLGEIALFAGDLAPSGWEFAEGQERDIIPANFALYQVLEAAFGGVTGQKFRLPDLRGRLGVGFEQGPGLADVAMGQRWGLETTLLTINNLPTHAHDYVAIPEPGGAAFLLLSAAAPLIRRRSNRAAR